MPKLAMPIYTAIFPFLKKYFSAWGHAPLKITNVSHCIGYMHGGSMGMWIIHAHMLGYTMKTDGSISTPWVNLNPMKFWF